MELLLQHISDSAATPDVTGKVPIDYLLNHKEADTVGGQVGGLYSGVGYPVFCIGLPSRLILCLFCCAQENIYALLRVHRQSLWQSSIRLQLLKVTDAKELGQLVMKTLREQVCWYVRQLCCRKSWRHHARWIYFQVVAYRLTLLRSSSQKSKKVRKVKRKTSKSSAPVVDSADSSWRQYAKTLWKPWQDLANAVQTQKQGTNQLGFIPYYVTIQPLLRHFELCVEQLTTQGCTLDEYHSFVATLFWLVPLCQ